MDEEAADEVPALGQLLIDLRDSGCPDPDWLDAHVRDGRFVGAWLTTFEPLDVWRVLRHQAEPAPLARATIVSALMVAPMLDSFPDIREAREAVEDWLEGEALRLLPLVVARDVLGAAATARTLGLEQMCAASAFADLIELLHAMSAGELTLEHASSLALSAVEGAVDALALERREAAYREAVAVGVSEAQAQRVALLAFECAEEARGAQLAARLTASVECPRVDALGRGDEDVSSP